MTCKNIWKLLLVIMIVAVTACGGGDQSEGDPDTPLPNNSCAVLPTDNPWNTDISAYPLHPNSENFIAAIGADTSLHPDFGTVWNGAPNGIPFVYVDDSTAGLPVNFLYNDESDAGPYPIPDNPPIEGGPNGQGDRHIIMVDRDNCMLYELFDAWPPGTGNNPSNDTWYAGSGAIFDLTSNRLRPDYWTSADAAGLPIYPGLVRYEEAVEQGEINHALRFTLVQTQRGFIHPATHFASAITDANVPPMGLRLRLKADYDISGFPSEVQVILRALKTYGMIVADNGGDMFISGAPHANWNDDNLREINSVTASDFEVIDTGDIIR